jgi:hypothetical protein
MPAGSKIFQSVLPGATVPTLAADTDDPEPGAVETGADIRADGVATSTVIVSSVAKDLRADLTLLISSRGARNSPLTPLYLRQSQTPV